MSILNKTEYQMTEAIEKLPLPWFGADHGIDSFEDVLDVSEILFYKAIWHYLSGSEVWNVHLHITFRNRAKMEMDLTMKGYDYFLKALRMSYDLKRHV